MPHTNPNKVWLVHISDLHLKKNLPGLGALLSGHDQRVLITLSTFLRVFVATHPEGQKVLVMSGDATSTGDMTELALYRQVIDAGLSLGPIQMPPLCEGFDHVVELPGNHDYWDGSVIGPSLAPASVVAPYFPQHRRSAVLDFDHGQELALHSICSTAGASWSQQVGAVGEYRKSDVDALIAAMRAPTKAKRTYHIIVTHHSASHGSTWFQGMSHVAKRHLESVKAQFRHLVGMLSGHAHWIKVTQQPNLPIEARSGTTLQQVPVPPKKRKNTFLVHELTNHGTSIKWSAIEYDFASGRFVPGLTHVIIP